MRLMSALPPLFRTRATHLGPAALLLLLCLAWGNGPAKAQPAAPASSAAPTEAPERLGVSHGTGFSVGQGYILTAQHVVRNATRVLVGQGPGKWVAAEVVKTDAVLDLALLRTPLNLPGARIARSASVPVGLEIFVVGYPQPSIQGMSLKITQGLINGHSRTQPPGTDKGYFQISAEVSRGNSGGPLIGSDGSVIGMVQRKLDSQRVLERTQEWTVNVSFALRSGHLIDFLEGTPAATAPETLDVQSNLRPHQIYAQAQALVVPVVAASRGTAPGSGPAASSGASPTSGQRPPASNLRD